MGVLLFTLPPSSPNENFNYGLAPFALSSPSISTPLSGTVTWTVAAALASATGPELSYWSSTYGCSDIAAGCGIESTMFWVDGRLQAQFTGLSTTVDTTLLSNGAHEFYVSPWKDSIGVRMRMGGLKYALMVDNGHTAMALSTGYKDVRLAPADTLTLAPVMLYTDGVNVPLASGVTFASDTPGVATVGSSSGVITGVANGACLVTATHTSSGKTAVARVVVNATAGFPHFGKTGTLRSTYDATDSLFLATMFYGSPDLIGQVSGVETDLLAAGINTLTTGFFRNPADNGSLSSFALWQASFDSDWSSKTSVANAHGFLLFLIGDDIARSPAELNFSITSSYSTAAIQYAMNAVKQSGIVVAVDMIDEVNFAWGSTPFPSDGRWVGYSPSIPDSAFTTLLGRIHGSATRPALSWPISGNFDVSHAANWMGDPAVSEFASHYYDVNDWKEAYRFQGRSLKEIQMWMGDSTLYGRRPVLQLAKPQITLVTCAGPYYTKHVAGNDYVEGTDYLQGQGVDPKMVLGQIMFAAIAGMSGIRMYAYDWPQWKSERSGAALNAANLQTGSEPYAVGVTRWGAMSLGLNFLHSRKGLLFQQPIHAVDLGPNFESAARRGANGTVLIAMNFSASPQPTVVNLAPYITGADITRYRVTVTGVVTQTIASASSDSVTFGVGETIAYVVP